jgi:hypothetical protein
VAIISFANAVIASIAHHRYVSERNPDSTAICASRFSLAFSPHIRRHDNTGYREIEIESRNC